MFALKKLITALLTIPGIFILFLVITGIYGYKKKIFALKFNLWAGIILYFLSISFITNNLIGFIERESVYNGKPQVDAIILLGGGVIEGVPDISGTGIPSPDMTMRVVDTVRLYKKYKHPIIVSGGSLPGRVREAGIVGRFLLDLGVEEKDIILEDSSMDTVENALNVKEIFLKKGYKKGLLVTSAFHIKRSEFLFKIAGLDVYPHSCGYLSDQDAIIDLYSFLPNANELRKTTIMIKEAMGTIFYYIKTYGIF
ncbi:MAG: YdcF family protein [Spirochaetes bacterium]|nr:YdcF family protein [Spirochaetota bacterium]